MEKYEIRTMQGDLERLTGKKSSSPTFIKKKKETKDGQPPENLPVASSVSLTKKKRKIRRVFKKKVFFKKPHISLEKFYPPKFKKGVSFLKTGYIVVLVIAVFFVLVSISRYWQNNFQVVEEIDNYSIISVEQIEIIKMQSREEGLEQLKSLVEANQQIGTLKRVLLKDLSSKEAAHYLLTQEVLDLLGLQVPVSISKKLENDYMLLLYGQEDGNRIGLVIKVINPKEIKTELKEWENDMVLDLIPLFLNKELELPKTPTFSEEVYKGISIRYIDLLKPDLGIDYTVVGDYLIIATSKREIKSIINRFVE